MTTATHPYLPCPNCRRRAPRSHRLDTTEVPVVITAMGMVLIALALAMAVILVGVAV